MKRWNRELIQAEIKEHWKILNDEEIKLTTYIQAECLKCGSVSSKKASKFVYAKQQGKSGCKQCHVMYTQSAEFAEERRKVGLKHAEKARELGRERMNALYEAQPEKRYELTQHLHEPENKKKQTEGKRRFWKTERGAEYKQKLAQRHRLSMNKPEAVRKRLNKLRQWEKDNPEKAQMRTDKAKAIAQTPEGREKSRQMIKKNEPWKACYQNSKAELDLFTEIKHLCGDAVSGQYFKDHERSFQADVFVPSRNIAIEYNGAYWHTEDKKGKHYHLEKTAFFEARNIRLIHIFDFEWKYRRQQVLDFIKSTLQVNQRVFARKCVLEEISKQEAKTFIDANHIQEAPKRGISYCLGLFSPSGELLSVATFGKHHRNKQTWVLNRFCCKHGINVIGGLSKLSKNASHKLGSEIISWADKRFSNGSGYLSAGWQIEEILKPDYFYWKDGQVIPKQARMKSKAGTPQGMTEYEHAMSDGLLRVWDSGKIRLVFKRKRS